MTGIKILVILLSVSSISLAQKGIELTLQYNENSDKYEVYAKPNFTKRNFFLGPSQITLVLPSSVTDEKLRISNVDGGAWEDNSMVYSPTVSANNDYHGISTLGAKTDLVEGNETLLFSFSLAKGINSSEVYLFENGKDPNSSALGMKGGDFSISLNDATSGDFFLRNYKKYPQKTIDLKDDKSDLLELENINLFLYPNTTNGDFKVMLSEVSDDEFVTMIVTTEMGSEVMKISATKRSIEERTFKVPLELSSQSLVVRIKSSTKIFGRKLILNRE